MKPDEMETLDDFAMGLMRLRNTSGLTREQVKELVLDAGEVISTATISAICNGDFIPRPYYLRVFLQALGVEGEEQEAWQQARDRLWFNRQQTKRRQPAKVEPPQQPTSVEGELFLVRQQLSRMEGMLMALAREWGINKRDV